MRWFKRSIPDSSEETPEAVNAEPNTAEPKPETPPDPRAAIKSDLALAMAQYGAQSGASEEENIAILGQEAPIVSLTNTLWQRAIKEGASQILLEPDPGALRVRHRVDGILYEAMAMPPYLKAVVVSRFLILAGVNLATVRLPQSGRIHVCYEEIPYDLRVNSVPTEYGVSLSMRILDKRKALVGLNKLGMTVEVQDQVEELIQFRSGIFLVTGPVACGKSVTLYNLMNKLNTVDRHSAAIESETEYHLGGITTVPVKGRNGLTYAQAFRSLVLAEAQVILAERLPDAESWNAALTASEEGTLVLASLTLRDAPTALWRLRNMGLDAERLSQNITGILAQRLVRKICVHCKELYEVTAGDLRVFGLKGRNAAEKIQLARGAGCEQCRKTGYKGRIGIFSLLRVNQEIRDKIVRGDFSPDLYESALANGMHPLREDGLEKILLGLTTVDEVYAVVGQDRL